MGTNDIFFHEIIYPGQYYDAETGLHQNYHRDYDSKTGRYIQADPVGLEGGINPFVYTENNPVNLTDPYELLSSQQQKAIANWTAAGSAIGGILGLLGGGGTGFLTGPGAPVAIPAGAITGSIKGSLVGGAAGAAVGLLIARSTDKSNGADRQDKCGDKGGRGNRSVGKKQVDAVAKEFNMTPEQRFKFGDYIEEMKRMVSRGGADNLTIRELREIAKEFLGK